MSQSTPSGRLTAEDVGEVALEILSSPPDDLRQPASDRKFLAKEAVKRKDILELRMQGELSAARIASRAARLRQYPRIYVALLIVVLSSLLLIRYFHAIFYTPTRDGWITLSVLGGLILSSLLFALANINPWISSRAVWKSALDTFDEALHSQVEDALREIINDRWAEEELWGLEFDSYSAPSMVGVTVDNAVSSTTYLELSAFIQEHSTSAIGLAGPRGIGKSTLMDQLRMDPQINCIGVRIPAPRRYEPASLVRVIHRAVCNEVLWPGGVGRPSEKRPFFDSATGWVLKSFFAGVAVILWIVLWSIDSSNRSYLDDTTTSGIRVDYTTIFLLVAGGVLISLLMSNMWYWLNEFTMRAGQAALPRSSSSTLARRELEKLNYAKAIQSKTSFGWKLGILNAAGEDQTSLTERASTDADSVGALTLFLTDLRRKSRKSVLISIDELDKIDNSNDVISMINGVKDLFHTPGVHILISVSTDAMHSFAARGVLVRDVFDSAFDTVILVPRMTFDESREVLWRRTTSFSVPAMMFCHVWSGGHPRDLIRAARACVTIRARKGRSLMLTELVDTIVLRDVMDLLEAAASRLYDSQLLAASQNSALLTVSDPSHLNELREIMALQELLLESTGPLHQRIRPLLAGGRLPEISGPQVESSALVRALNPYIRFAACVSELFGELRTAMQWRSELVAETLQIMAGAQVALSKHAEEADRAMKRAESHLQSLAESNIDSMAT